VIFDRLQHVRVTLVLIMLISTAAFVIKAPSTPNVFRFGTDFETLRVVGDLEQRALFSNASAARQAQAQDANAGYVLVVWFLAKIDARVFKSSACAAANKISCTNTAAITSLVWFNRVAAVGALVLVFFVGLVATRSVEAASVGLLLTSVFGRFADHTALLTPDVSFAVIFVAALLAAMCAIRWRAFGYLNFAIAGMLFAVACLFRVQALPVTILALLALAVIAWRQSSLVRSMTLSVTFITAFALVVGPLVAMRWFDLGDPWPAFGPSARLWAHRLELNAMSLLEWAALISQSIPLIGQAVVSIAFPADVFERFRGWSPTTFQYIAYQDRLPAAAASADKSLVWLALMKDAPAFTVVNHMFTGLALAISGLFASCGLAAVFALAYIRGTFQTARRRPDSGPLAILAIGCISLLLVFSALTPTDHWLIIPVVMLPAVVVGYVVRCP